MTKDKDEKAVIRARMAKTGESYATARAQLAKAGSGQAAAQARSTMSLSHRAGQALEAAGRVDGGPWVLIHALRTTRGTAGHVLEELGFPALSYDEFIRLASPLGSRDTAKPFDDEDSRTALIGHAGALASAESRALLDSSCLLRVCVERLRPEDVPTADAGLLQHLKSADLKAMSDAHEAGEGREGEAPKEGRGLFERFTDRARVAVVASQEEARALGHGWIGTEHLLLGLLKEGAGVGAHVLVANGMSLDALRQAVVDIIGEVDAEPAGHIPFTPRAKTVLELALEEAVTLGHEHIGTEHLLLALLAEGEGIAAQVLASAGLEADSLREQVLAAVGDLYPKPE